MKQKLQKATAVMVAVLASTGQALAQTAPATPAPAAPGLQIDFLALFPAVATTFGFGLEHVFFGVVGAIGAAAAIKVSPNVARWGFDNVICWFGGDLAAKVSQIESRREKGRSRKRHEEWKDWKVKQYKRQDEERREDEYFERKRNEEMREHRRNRYADY